MTNSPDSIRTAVREHYAARARSASTGGTGPCCGNELYDAKLLVDMPSDLADFSLGCGDPISLSALQPGETVLDLGSGGGLDCFLAAKQVGQTGAVIGVDMTPEMIERARTAAARLGADNVEFRQGYLESLPVEDGSVDGVISNCVINLSPDKPQVFREIFRVLKPGGRLAVSDIVTNGPISQLMARGLKAWAACVAGALDAKDYRDGLAAAGFTDVRVVAKEGNTNRLLAHMPIGAPFSALIVARKPSSPHGGLG